MPRNLVATATITINAPPERVWRALTDPAIVTTYYFGTTIETDWVVGHPITWSGEWEGTAYQDRGVVLAASEPELLEMTHFSPLTGLDDVPENYHRLTYRLAREGGSTVVTLDQDNNADADAADHSAGMWATLLTSLKTVVESAD